MSRLWHLGGVASIAFMMVVFGFGLLPRGFQPVVVGVVILWTCWTSYNIGKKEGK